MIITFYNKIFKGKFFNKVFLIYSLITICAIIIIAHMASLNIDISLKNKETQNNSKVLTNINVFFEQKISSSKNIAVNTYTNNPIISDIIYLSKNGYNKYIHYKYDKLLNSNENKYNGFENFFDSCLYRDKDIVGICIYSSTQSDAFMYSNRGLTIHNKNPIITDYIKNSWTKDQGIMIIPSHSVDYGDKNDSRAFTVVYQVKDTFSSDIACHIAIDYSLEGINKEFSKYSRDYKGNVLIFTNKGKTIYDSSNLYYNTDCNFYSTLKNLQKDSKLYDKNIIDTVISSHSDTLGAAILPLKLLKNSRNNSSRTIYLISIACITLTLLLTFIIIKTFSKRINLLMHGIKCMDTGNHSSRIVVKNKGDEISDIAKSFNNMCDNLNKYIQKVYVLDIKQKQAQLKALQAQINPHFLYNTLESIRMRALVNGSKDVAQMIYLLSALFRNSVREKSIINISEEIKYCKMYMELFNMKFMDSIKLTFDVKEDTLNYGIIKHSIQPLIENYIIHGINTQRDDNVLTIRVFKYNDEIYIYIIDNGMGIPCKKLNDILKSFKNTHIENGCNLGINGEKNCDLDSNVKKDSDLDINSQKNSGLVPNVEKGPDLEINVENDSGLGLKNVNERIGLLFGNMYGIDIYSEYGKGTVVLMKLPAKTREELERNVQFDNS